MLDGREVVYVERLESPHMLRMFVEVGHRNSAHCTGTGKVLLAHLPERRLAGLLAGWRPERKTDATVCDPAQLRAELDRVRAQGWAENSPRVELGVASVGRARSATPAARSSPR